MRHALRPPAPRGQATVELALGIVLFVTLLIGGLHLAEDSYLSLKVQEASVAAMWETSGWRVEDFSNPSSSGSIFARAATHIATASSVAQSRYRFFDIRGGAAPQRLFTRGTAVAVACAPGSRATLSFGIPSAGLSGADVSALQNWYQDRGQVQCAASATALPFNLPTGFATRAEGGFNQVQLASTAALQLCGVGSPVGFACPGRLNVLLGDWSLDQGPGNSLNKQHPLSALSPSDKSQTFADVNQCSPTGQFNWQFCEMTKTLFETSGSAYGAGQSSTNPGAASEFAKSIGKTNLPSPYQFNQLYHGSPYNERKFAMSFVGVEGDKTSFWNGMSGFGPYVDEVNPYMPRATGGPPYNAAWCDSCHFNTSGTAPVQGNPDPGSAPGNGVNNYKQLRSNCFLGLTRNGGCGTPNPQGSPGPPY